MSLNVKYMTQMAVPPITDNTAVIDVSTIYANSDPDIVGSTSDEFLFVIFDGSPAIRYTIQGKFSFLNCFVKHLHI